MVLIVVALVYNWNKDSADKQTTKIDISTVKSNAASTILPTISNMNQAAPDFTLTNLQGEAVKLSDFKGKKVIINFWATWCKYCVTEMPDIEKFHQNNPNVVILGVNVDPSSDVARFVKDKGLTFPILLDNEMKVATSYLIQPLPTTYFIDEEGIAYFKKEGSMNYEFMEAASKIQ